MILEPKRDHRKRTGGPWRRLFLFVVLACTVGRCSFFADGLKFPDLEKVLAKVSREASYERYRVECQGALTYLGPLGEAGVQQERDCPLVFTLERSKEGWSVLNLGSSFAPLNKRLRISNLKIESQEEKDGKWSLVLIWEMARREVGQDASLIDLASDVTSQGVWSIGGKGRTEMRAHRLSLSFGKKQNELSFSVVLKGAVGKDTPASMPPPAPDEPTKISLEELDRYFVGSSRQDLSFELCWKDEEPQVGELVSPGWNRGLHRLRKSDLKLSPNGISGEITVAFQPDPLIPLDRLPRQMAYHIDLVKAKGWNGSYEGGGSWPERKGLLEVRGGEVLRGHYQIKGVDGKREGEVIARGGPLHVERRDDSRTQLLEMLGEELDVDAPLIQTKVPAEGNKLYLDILQKQAITLLSDGWRVEAPQQEFEPDLMGVQLAEALPRGEVPILEEKTFTWFRPAHWQVMGPFREERTSGRAVAPLLPEIVHGGISETVFSDTRVEFGKTVTYPRSWVLAQEVGGWVHLPDELERSLWLSGEKLSNHREHPLPLAYRSLEMKGRSAIWFASTTIKVKKTKTFWLAIGGREKLGLYLNGQRVFTKRSLDDGGRLHTIPLQLEKGEHRLLVRVGMDDLDYFPREGKGPSGFRFFVGNGYLSDPLKIREPPHAETSGVGSASFDHHWSDAPLVLGDSEEGGVEWSVSARFGRSRPVRAEDRLIMTSWGGWVEARSIEDGRLLWEKQLGGRSRPSTPAVIDDGVVVHFAPGFLARMSLDGQVLWEVVTGAPDELGSPPLVVNDVVLVQTLEERSSPDALLVLQSIQARSLKNGELLWEHREGLPRRGQVPVLPAGGVPLVVSASGEVYEVQSGKKYPWNLLDGHDLPKAGLHLVSHGDEIHVSSSSVRMAFKFAMGASGLEVQQLYLELGIGSPMGDPLLLGEELWVPELRHHSRRKPRGHLNAFGRKEGQLLAKVLPFESTSSNPLVLLGVGNRVVSVDPGTGGKAKGGEASVKVAVIEGGAAPRILARRNFGRGTGLLAGPMVAENRMVLRFQERLLSIRLDEGGEEAIRRQSAKSLLDEIGTPKKKQEVVEPPHDAWAMGPEFSLSDAPSPFEWWRNGPLAIEDRGKQEWAHTFSRNGWTGPGAFNPMQEKYVSSTVVLEVDREGKKFFAPRNQLNLTKATEGKANSRFFFTASLKVNEGKIYRLKVASRNVKMAISGVPLEDGQLVKLTPGQYSLLAKVDLMRAPAFGKVSLDVQLLDALNFDGTYRSWLKKVRTRERQLKAVASEFKGADLGFRSQELLELLKSEKK